MSIYITQSIAAKVLLCGIIENVNLRILALNNHAMLKSENKAAFLCVRA